MTKRDKKITISTASLFLTSNTLSFGFNESHTNKSNEIFMCGDDGENIAIIY